MKYKSHFTIIALATIFLAVILMACRYPSDIDIYYGGGSTGGDNGGGGSGNFPPAGQQFNVTVQSVHTGLGWSSAGAGATPVFTNSPPNASTPTAAPAATISATHGQVVTINTTRPNPDFAICSLEFSKWRVVSGNVTFTDISVRTRETASFIMPAEDVVIEAIFVDGNMIFSTGCVYSGCVNFICGCGNFIYGIIGLHWAMPSNVIIPSSRRGNAIQGIRGRRGSGSFSLPFINLTSVTIPDSVTYIGFSAFEHSPNLEKITIFGNNVTIYNCTFRGNFYAVYDGTPGTFVWDSGIGSWVRLP